MEEAKKVEELVRRKVQEIKTQISALEKELVIQEEDLQRRTENRRFYEEQSFENAYGHSAQKVREDYVKLINACCYSGGDGYEVRVPGLNPKNAPHWVLRPDKRAICEPSPLVKEAYKIIGINVYIANTTHIERWGN